MSTIVRTKRGYYGSSKYDPSVKIQDTIEATVREIGRGAITVGHVLWAVNMQLTDPYERLTEAQVKRGLATLTRRWRRFVSRGHGVYRWLEKEVS